MASEGWTTLSLLKQLFSIGTYDCSLNFTNEKLKFRTVFTFEKYNGFFFFFLSFNNFHSYYFASLVGGEYPRFFSARLGTFQSYIYGKEKSLFSLILWLRLGIIQITRLEVSFFRNLSQVWRGLFQFTCSLCQFEALLLRFQESLALNTVALNRNRIMPHHSLSVKFPCLNRLESKPIGMSTVREICFFWNFDLRKLSYSY